MRRSWVLAALALVYAQDAARAQAPLAPDSANLPTIEVIGTTPLLGSGIDRDKVPANPRSFDARELSRAGPADLAGTLEQRIPGVNVNGVQDSPFQPDIQYRGFDASPILGTPQGLAVYQNGVRINESFGDTVNWDLVPDFAVNRVNLVSSNPVFGLNALGGALALEMKNGFNFQGGKAELSGGSFGRRDGTIEYGIQSGGIGAYLGARGLFEDGWREHSPSSIHQLYADLGVSGNDLSAHLSFAGASNLINAIGPTPADLLARNRSAVYTTPQSTRNDLAFLTLSGAWQASATTSLEGNAYYRHFRQRVSNGNTSNAQPCDPGVAPGLLCFNDATTLLFATTGRPIPDVSNGNPLGEVDRTATDTDGIGASLQLTATAPVFDRGNHFVAGVSVDHGRTDYAATSELGVIGSGLIVTGSGFFIDQPSGDLAPVKLVTTNLYTGVYATDTVDVTSRLAVTLSARFNLALLRLEDQNGTSLSGSHRYSRLNPAAGATYKLSDDVTTYAGYSETNRAPTPGELACADPTRPCLIDNFLVSDPTLKQVVARTWEAGIRGGFAALEETGRVTWNVGVFRTDSQDEILNVPSTLSGFGFFENAGNTRRQGIEAGLSYKSDRWFVFGDYALLDATFRSTITLSSPFNPFAAADGTITIHPGDRLPSLPRHRFKLGADYKITPQWTLGGTLVVAGGQFLRGDEANLNPQLPGYAIVTLHSSYALGEHAEIFALVQNLFDARYETFGTFFDRTQIPSLGLTDPRTLSPGAPLAVFVGARVLF